MTSKTSSSVTQWFDPSFDPRKTDAYDLSVLLREEDYFFMVTGLEKNRPLALGRILRTSVPQIGKKDSSEFKLLPAGIFKRLFIYHYSPKFSLLPVDYKDVFDNQSSSTSFTDEHASLTTATSLLPEDILCRFWDPIQSREFLNAFSSEVTPRHFAESAITIASRLSRKKGTDILLAICGHSLLTIVIFSNDGLLLANAFLARTAEDAAYHLLNVYRHFAPQTKDMVCVLAGDISINQKAGIMALPYLDRKEDFALSCFDVNLMELVGEEAVFLGSICAL